MIAHSLNALGGVGRGCEGGQLMFGMGDSTPSRLAWSSASRPHRTNGLVVGIPRLLAFVLLAALLCRQPGAAQKRPNEVFYPLAEGTNMTLWTGGAAAVASKHPPGRGGAGRGVPGRGAV